MSGVGQPLIPRTPGLLAFPKGKGLSLDTAEAHSPSEECSLRCNLGLLFPELPSPPPLRPSHPDPGLCQVLDQVMGCL